VAFLEKLKSFLKAAVPFPEGSNTAAHVTIYPNMNSLQDAILRAISPQVGPSDDPHLSSLVAAGYTWLGITLPEPDLQVKKEFRRKAGGKKRDDNIIEKHPLYDLFERPNPYMSGSNLWKAFAYSWIIDGNAYWLKTRNRVGQVVEIWPEPHQFIQARWINDLNGEYIPAAASRSVASVPRDDSSDAFINYYELSRDGSKYRVEPGDVVHFRDGMDPVHRRYGLSKMTTILREIYGDSAVATYSARLLSGNGVIPFVMGIDDSDGLLNQEDLDNIKARLNHQTTGSNAGQGIVLSSRMTFERTGLTPSEMDLRTSRYMAQEVFSAVTGLPPQVLNFGAGLERSIYNNMAEADRRAVDQYLQPLWWHVAQELTHQLLPDFDQDESHFVEFDLTEVGALQEDANDRAARMVQLYQGGLIKRSWAQQELGYESDPSGADDVYYVAAGSETVTIEDEQELRAMALEPPAPPPQLEAPEEKPLQLVKGRHSGNLKGAPETIKRLYEAQ
jgi:HK97 family phage portal protein